MKISELHIGELYACNGRRCRLERTWTDVDGVAKAEVAMGRSFERSQEISASRFYHKDDIVALTNTWEDHKIVKQKIKEANQRAEKLSLRLRNALEDRGMYGWVDSSGRASINGSLNEIEALVLDLETLGQKKSTNALGAIFGN